MKPLSFLRYGSSHFASGKSLRFMESFGNHPLFNYTSGRWVYNEEKRLDERRRCFNVDGMKRLAAKAVSRSYDDIIAFRKLGEGAANRAFLIEFADKFKLVARIPYPVTQPRQRLVASEAATMVFLRSNGIPVPQIYGYSASDDNPAGTEYILMEFCRGLPLSSVWSSMSEDDRIRFVTSLVDLEARIARFHFPGSGSLYFPHDLPETDGRLAVDSMASKGSNKTFHLGPNTSLQFWFGKRYRFSFDRGPFTDIESVMNAGAQKEMSYLQKRGRPLLPFDRMRRESFLLQKQFPSVHCDSLEKYLQISKYLIPRADSGILCPVIAHPDLRPSNIFVSNDFEITSVIDWQGATILPRFLHSRIPEDLDNSADFESRSREMPRLPANLSELSETSQATQLELFSKRQLYHFYMNETAIANPMHFAALNHPFSVGRRRLFDLSGAPWQGDNIPLRSSLVFVEQHWQEISDQSDIICPIKFSEEEKRDCLRLDEDERQAMEQLEASKNMLGLGPEGWVASDRYEAVQDAISRMKTMCLEEAETDLERLAIRDHWVYDDMDEDEYL